MVPGVVLRGACILEAGLVTVTRLDAPLTRARVLLNVPEQLAAVDNCKTAVVIH